MASNTLFISTDYLKKNSLIQSNVDNELLQPIIILVQDKYIEPILGSQLYSKIVTDIQTNAYSASSAYKTLLVTYIQPTIVQYCIAEGLEQIATQTTNIGVMNKSAENASSAEEARVIKLEDKALQNGNFYAERLIKYLRANYTLYPELNPTNPDCATIFPQNNAYFSGINIAPPDRTIFNRDNNNNNYSW